MLGEDNMQFSYPEKADDWIVRLYLNIAQFIFKRFYLDERWAYYWFNKARKRIDKNLKNHPKK